MSESEVALRTTRSRARADEWVLVLAAEGLSPRIRAEGDAFVLLLREHQVAGALDALAAESQRRAEVAIKEGRFDRSLVQVNNLDGSLALDREEFPRPGTTAESLAKLPPSFPAIADYRHGIMVLDPDSGRIEPFLTDRYTEHFRGCNDLVFAANGDMYFTDQGQSGLHQPDGRVYRHTAAGRLECLIDNAPSPNGIVLGKDETVLYVAMTRGNSVWRLPLMEDGGVSKAGLFVQLSGGLAGPDGLALDEDDRLFVAHVGNGTVWVFTRFGEPVYRVRSCAGIETTNVAFGGNDGKKLFVVESGTGSILEADLDVAGKGMYSHST